MVVKNVNVKETTPKLKCNMCEKDYSLITGNYYNHKNKFVSSERFPLCKGCIDEYIGDKESVGYKERVIEILRELNQPFLPDLWEKSEHNFNKSTSNYIRNIGLPQYKDMTFDDSVFYAIEKKTVIAEDPLIEKWGSGYTDEEYVAFERKYKFLTNNYQEKTNMHTEALMIYVRYRVKEELATAKGDSRAAKEWGTMAKDQATAAKINPSQFSKSDLTNGMDSFGELVRSVESVVDVIEILPRFKQRPNDKVDFNIWCYINYARDLEGMEPVSYEDVYKFLEQRTKDFEESLTEEEIGDAF
jgi:hypothetical protein